MKRELPHTLSYDPKTPKRLKETQHWFASIIGRPIDLHNHMQAESPSGIPMETEACKYIAPSPTLKPHQRIEIYNQQYWWRLLAILHDSFPLLTRLFGFTVFNMTIGMPYLEKYPPNHWSLSLLGSRICQWIEEEYHEEDKQFILDAALIDWTYESNLLIAESPPLSLAKDNKEASVNLLTLPLALQKHVNLLKMDYDLLSFRDIFIKEKGDHWIDNDFPELQGGKTFYYTIYRNHNHTMSWKEISFAEYALLSEFKNGATIEEACEKLEKKQPFLLDEASKKIHIWFQEWAIRKWLTTYTQP